MDPRHRHNLSAIRASHARDWDSWRALVTDRPTDRQRAAAVALTQRLAVGPDAGSAAIQEAMSADHRGDLRTYLEHLATQDRWTADPSAEVRRLAGVVWQQRDETAAHGPSDALHERHRAELTEVLTDVHIERLDSEGDTYNGFNDVRYYWNRTLAGGDDWMPRYAAAQADETLGRTAAIGLNPGVPSGAAVEPTQTAAHRPAQTSARGIIRS